MMGMALCTSGGQGSGSEYPYSESARKFALNEFVCSIDLQSHCDNAPSKTT